MTRLRKRVARSATLLEPIARWRGWSIIPGKGPDGTPRRHALYSPPTDRRVTPLLVAFHGRDGTPFEFVFTSLPGLAAQRGWRVLCPDRRSIESQDLACEEELRALLGENHWSRHSSIYALGFSRGGALAVRLALRDPGTFRAAASVAGAEMAAPLAELDDAKATPPVFLAHGLCDPVAPPEGSQELAAALHHLGHRVRLEVLPDLGHDLAVLDRALPQIFDFFEAQGATAP